MELTPEQRLDLQSLRSNKIAPELLRRKDTPHKRYSRAVKNSARIAEVTAIVENLAPKLREARRSKLAEWLEVQLILDPLSFDLSNGIRASRLMLAGEVKTATAIMDGITGIFEEEKKDKPIQHVHDSETGGIELRPFVAARIPQSPLLGNGKELLDNIGSGRK